MELTTQQRPAGGGGLPAKLHNAVIDGVTALLGLPWDHRTKPKAEDRDGVYPGWLAAVAHVYLHAELDAEELAADVAAAFAELCACAGRSTPWPAPVDLLRRAVPGPVLARMAREEAEAEQAVAKLPEAQVAAEQARIEAQRRADEAAAAEAAARRESALERGRFRPLSRERARERLRALKQEQTVRAALIARRDARGGRTGALLASPDPLDRINGLRFARGLPPLPALPPEHEENTRRRARGEPSLLHADSDARAEGPATAETSAPAED